MIEYSHTYTYYSPSLGFAATRPSLRGWGRVEEAQTLRELVQATRDTEDAQRKQRSTRSELHKAKAAQAEEEALKNKAIESARYMKPYCSLCPYISNLGGIIEELCPQHIIQISSMNFRILPYVGLSEDYSQ